jgi:hypothetical protein
MKQEAENRSVKRAPPPIGGKRASARGAFPKIAQGGPQPAPNQNTQDQTHSCIFFEKAFTAILSVFIIILPVLGRQMGKSYSFTPR